MIQRNIPPKTPVSPPILEPEVFLFGNLPKNAVEYASLTSKEDYVFGFDDLWILAPQRDGPHNWEDVGIRSILRAIELLAQQVRLETADGSVGADANRSSVFFFTTKGGWGGGFVDVRIWGGCEKFGKFIERKISAAGGKTGNHTLGV